MKIDLCCHNPAPDSRDNQVNKQMTDFFSLMAKKKKEYQFDCLIPAVYSPVCQYDDKYYPGDILYRGVTERNRDCYHPAGHDTTQLYSAPDKIKNRLFLNDSIPHQPGDAPDESPPADRPAISPPGEVYYSDADIRTEDKTAADGVTAELPRLPVFPGNPVPVSPREITHLPLRHEDAGKSIQEKLPLVVCYTEKNRLSPEHSRTDYYFSYHFRQKYQPAEQVYIYREQPGRFKLDVASESLKRRLKSSVNINGIDNIDIL